MADEMDLSSLAFGMHRSIHSSCAAARTFKINAPHHTSCHDNSDTSNPISYKLQGLNPVDQRHTESTRSQRGVNKESTRSQQRRQGPEARKNETTQVQETQQATRQGTPRHNHHAKAPNGTSGRRTPHTVSQDGQYRKQCCCVHCQ